MVCANVAVVHLYKCFWCAVVCFNLQIKCCGVYFAHEKSLHVFALCAAECQRIAFFHKGVCAATFLAVPRVVGVGDSIAFAGIAVHNAETVIWVADKGKSVVFFFRFLVCA